MSIILTIAKQEIVKVFKNKKMLSSIFVLSLVVLAAMFAMTSLTVSKAQEQEVSTVNGEIAEREAVRAELLEKEGLEQMHFTILAEDTSTELERTNRTASFILPYMMIIILFMNLVNVVGDSIAGEKERGTLSKQLLSPIDNSQMIFGKLLGTTVIGMISGAVFLGVLLGGSYVADRFWNMDILGIGNISLDAGQIAVMFGGFILIAMVFVAVIALLSSFAKTVKEATNFSLVIYYLVIVAALATGFIVGEIPRTAYLIPIYNFSVFMQKFMLGSMDLVNGIIMVASLLVTFGILATVTILNFRREKVIC